MSGTLDWRGDWRSRLRDEPMDLEEAPEEIQGDREMVLVAVAEMGDALEFASDEIRSDRDFVARAIELDPYCLPCAAVELQHDKELVLAAVRQNGCVIERLPCDWLDDHEVVLEAARKQRTILENCPTLWKDPRFSEWGLKQNCIAGQGVTAPVCSIEKLERANLGSAYGGWIVTIRLLSGDERMVRLRGAATLGELSHELVWKHLGDLATERKVQLCYEDRRFGVLDAMLPLEQLAR